MSFLKVNSLTKKYESGEYEIFALNDVSFKVEKGEFVIILGASGAGKTTILNILGGMDKPSFGEYSLGDIEVSSLKDNELTNFRRNQIGFVFQFYNLIPSLTALENVKLQESACLGQPHMDSVDALKAVGLEERLNNFPGQLSGGEQQRVSIARAIVKKPSLLLCDEPTGALDSNTGKNILKLLKELAAKENMTVIVVTHNSNIANIANHLIRIADGKIIEDRLIENPKDVDEIEW